MGRKRWILPGLVILAGVPVGLSGCGASYQVAYEADARFEHCYALDETPGVAQTARIGCWREWAARYQNEQTRDKVQYALGRAQAISTESARPEPVAAVAAPLVAADPSPPKVTAPAPTSAFAPPPKTEAVH